MTPWTKEEDDQLEEWYAQVNGQFHTYSYMENYLNEKFHGGKKIRNRRSISRREGHVLFGKPWNKK